MPGGIPLLMDRAFEGNETKGNWCSTSALFRWFRRIPTAFICRTMIGRFTRSATDRTIVPQAQGFPPDLVMHGRKTRRCLPVVPLIRPHGRGLASSVNTP